MERREAIKHTSLLLGFSLSASAVAAVMSGCRSEVPDDPEQPWEPVFFDNDQADLVAELTETIFPRTATPGARDVLVHQYIDLALKNHYVLRDQQEFMRGLATVDGRAMSNHGSVFVACTSEQKTALLEQMERDAHEARRAGYNLARQPFFLMLKELTYTGYFTSELIGEEYLSYDPIPGTYDGCIPLDDVGNSWSL